ncbi:glycoside hydrolase superfamily [Daldinia grandis]|nr:glycoside hydrolase superfamily [Daldinia grandis]
MSIRSVALAALVATVEVVAQDINVDIPSDLATRPLVPDVYGYSIEPVWVNDYISTPLAKNLLNAIAKITGKPPPIRVGGNTADQTYLHDKLSTGNDSFAIPTPLTAKQFNITPDWYDSWADYFPEGTDIIYTLNLAVNDSAWSIAVAQAEAVHKSLGKKLVQFELGNEIDHFINKGWRDQTWGVNAYVEQFRNITGQIVSSEWYKAAERKPTFQAGVFADPPWVLDQQDEVDDFSIENLTLVERKEDRDIIGSYATHLYPQSTCDGPRWLRMRLDLLSNHANISQYAPQVAAADKAGAPLVMGETNSVSCSGKSGISDTLGAALWSVDYVLLGASIGIRKTYFHLGAQSEYSAFTPKPYALKNETLAAGIRANWYAHYFVARVAATAAADGAELSVAALPGANTTALSGYAVYAGARDRRALSKLVFLDLGVWNGTRGLGNEATLRATDGASFSNGTRPSTAIRVATPWAGGREVRVARLTGPGTNAKSGVAVAGVTFDGRTGEVVRGETGGEGEEEEVVRVGEDGVLEVRVRRAEGVLLEVVDGDGDGDGGGGGNSGAAGKGSALWSGLFVAESEVALDGPSARRSPLEQVPSPVKKPSLPHLHLTLPAARAYLPAEYERDKEKEKKRELPSRHRAALGSQAARKYVLIACSQPIGGRPMWIQYPGVAS